MLLLIEQNLSCIFILNRVIFIHLNCVYQQDIIGITNKALDDHNLNFREIYNIKTEKKEGNDFKENITREFKVYLYIIT